MFEPVIADRRLTRTRVAFFVTGFATESARRFARRVERCGFTVELCREPDECSWTCMCTKPVELGSRALERAQDELEGLSLDLGGRSEGWGAAR